MIRTKRLEFNLVEHCNLRCLECSHLSPWMPRKFADFGTFRKDLEALGAVLRCETFKFGGGEPLLHPRLEEFLGFVRASGIAQDITLVTNGTEIREQPDSLFRLIDRLDFSRYEGTPTGPEHVEFAKRKCGEFSVRFKLLDKQEFRTMQLDRPNEDRELVRRIYHSCGIAHVFRAHVFRDGWYYKCSRPPFTGAYLEVRGLPGVDLSKCDGVAIHEPELESRLERYIADMAPLESCRYCLGTVGKGVVQRQMSASELRRAGADSRKPEDLVDFELLAFEEKRAGAGGPLPRKFPNRAIGKLATRLAGARPDRKKAPPRDGERPDHAGGG
ncbi:MAG: 4Fe-4S cluster-binding domain-containing protein [Planctomycetia bacterium]|nr:4Fe-4S cluster-binding domain-containing protein [Planctomycetia bacterium]